MHLLGRLGGMKGQSLGMLELDLDNLVLPFLDLMAGIGAKGGYSSGEGRVAFCTGAMTFR